MSNHPGDLLRAARRLTARRVGKRGPLPAAFIRRSISTAYYAVFHFLIEEATASVMGTASPIARRQALSRSFTHAGMKTAMGKMAGKTVDASVQTLFQAAGASSDVIVVPRFAREMAKIFIDAQTKREAADYHLADKFNADDARVLRSRVGGAIKQWQEADTPSDRDFKHCMCVLLLMKGQLRSGRD
jgi:hypothetical protein